VLRHGASLILVSICWYSAGSSAYLDQDELVEQHTSPHVGERDGYHDDQGTDHHTLRPGLEGQLVGRRGLLLPSRQDAGHDDGVG
jgi:hypothetical protein